MKNLSSSSFRKDGTTLYLNPGTQNLSVGNGLILDDDYLINMDGSTLKYTDSTNTPEVHEFAFKDDFSSASGIVIDGGTFL